MQFSNFATDARHAIQHFYRRGTVRRLKLYCSIDIIFIQQLHNVAFIHSNDFPAVIQEYYSLGQHLLVHNLAFISFQPFPKE